MRLKLQVNITTKNLLNENIEERTLRLNQKSFQSKQNRLNETEIQYNQRLEKQREYARDKRFKETEEERMIRLNLEKQKRINKKYNVSTLNIASISNQNIETFNVGQFNLVCSHCGAMYNRMEENTKGLYMRCCENGN